MNILAIVGSMAGEKSATAQLCGRLYRQLDEEIFHGTAEYECITMDKIKLDLCCSCNKCFSETGECVRRNADDLHILEDKMMTADIILMGSPVYMGSVSAALKGLLDRLAVWSHEMRLAGRIVVPVITAGSNHVPETQKYLGEMILAMGGIVPASLAAYTIQGQPMLKEEDRMREVLRACTVKIAAALENRTKFITREQRIMFSFWDDRYRDSFQRKQIFGIPAKGEAFEWERTGLPYEGSFEKYCMKNYPHAADAVCYEGERYFRPELAGWVNERQHYQCLTGIVSSLEGTLWLNYKTDILSAEAKTEISIAYARRLELLMAFTLESRIYRNVIKKNPAAMWNPNCIKPEEYSEASEELLSDLKKNRRELWKSFPRLLRLVQYSRRYFIEFMTEFLDAFYEHLPELEKTLFERRRCSKILHITCDAGDSHNHGRVTMIVETDAGKCVYKPHDLSVDVHMHDFMEKHFGNVTGAPAAVCCGNVGFCEFVENKPASDPAKAKIYYHNLGGFAAVLYMLGSTDFHEENILVKGLRPIPIDMETILNPEYANGKIQGEKDSFNLSIMTSVMKSGMGPMLVGTRECSTLHDTSDDNKSAPLINGKRQTIAGYEEDLLQGFDETYRYCLDHKTEILNDLKAMQRDKLRVVVRATQAYMTLLIKTYQPGWLKKKDIREDVQKALENSKVLGRSKLLENLSAAETDAICRGDIPYFCIEAGSCDLTGEGSVLKDYSEISALDAVEKHLNEMSRQDLDFQNEVLRAMCRKAVKLAETKEAETAAGHDTEETKKMTSLPNRSSGQLIAEAEELFDAIRRDGIRYTDGRLYWMGPEEKLRTAAAPVSCGLLDGNGGMGLFFAALARVTSKTDVKNEAAEMAEWQLEKLRYHIVDSERQLKQFKERETPAIDPGLNRGYAGVLSGICLLGRALGKTEEILPECQKLMNTIGQFPCREKSQGLADGRAGLLWSLCRHQELWELPEVPEKVRKLTNELLERQTFTDREVPDVKLWSNDIRKYPLSGYSRGQAGIAAALTLAARKLGRQDVLEAAGSALCFEESLYLEKTGGWPCLKESRYSKKPAFGLDGGTAGMGLALLHCQGETAERNLERAIRAAKQQEMLFCDSLSQGNALTAEFLMLYAEMTGEKRYFECARKLITSMTARAQRHGGFHYLTSEYRPMFLPTFLDGAAGVGYTLLRAAAPDEIGSIF